LKQAIVNERLRTVTVCPLSDREATALRRLITDMYGE
jgi:hypothetical protein